MSEFVVQSGTGEAEAALVAEPGELGELAVDPAEASQLDEVEDAGLPDADAPADPQEWIDQLIDKLLRAEQGIGAGPRDALMARIELARAYSELGDSVQAAPLAVENVLQAEELFPASEGWLQQLREFRDAACEAAGWTAAMMRRSEPEPYVPAVAPAFAAPHDFAPEYEAEPAEVEYNGGYDGEYAGAYIGDLPEGMADRFAEVAIEESARFEVESVQQAQVQVQAQPQPDFAAYEEIMRLRYELRDAHRTIERLRHVNRKLREALEYDPE